MTEEEELQFALALSLNGEQNRPQPEASSSRSRSPSPVIPQQTLRPELPNRTMSLQEQLAEVRRQRARHYQDHQVDTAIEATRTVDRKQEAEKVTKPAMATSVATTAGSSTAKKRALEETVESKGRQAKHDLVDDDDDDDEIEFVGIAKKPKPEPASPPSSRRPFSILTLHPEFSYDIRRAQARIPARL